MEFVKTTSIAGKDTTQEKPSAEIKLPIFSGDEHDKYPKQFLRDLDIYIQRKKIPKGDEKIVIGNTLKGKSTSWYTMIKDVAPDFQTFKKLFLKQYFSDKSNGIYLSNVQKQVLQVF